MADEAPLIRCANCGKMNRVRPAASGVPHCGSCGAALPWLTEAGEPDFPPVVEQSAKDIPGKIKLVKVNTDDAPNLSQRFGIRGIPTLILFDHGKAAARVTGALA